MYSLFSRAAAGGVFFWDELPETVNSGDPQACLLIGPDAFGPLETIESGNIQVRGGVKP